MQHQLETIIRTLAGTDPTNTLIASDFDGTLAAIVNDPSAATAVPGALAALAELSELGARVAVVSGRAVETLLELEDWSHIKGLTISGLHGAQTWHGGQITTLAQPRGLEALRTQLPALVKAEDPAIWVEDKRLSLVVHTRPADSPQASLETLRAPVTALAHTHGLEVVLGKLVLEIRIPGLSKADALSALLDEGPSAVVFAGDDLGDLPAIEALTQWRSRTGRHAVSIAVGQEQAVMQAADLRVDSPAVFAAMLGALAGRLRSARA